MTLIDLANQRLQAQRIGTDLLNKPSEAVSWLVAVQAQDYASAKWALGLRLRRATDADIEYAMAAGSILRTHVMRPTWHFVTPADIGWLQALTAPHVHRVNAIYYRRLELDKATFKRSHAILTKTLQGGRQMTRSELAAAFQQAGIAASGLRLIYLLVGAELDGIICSGAPRGKQFTYTLLNERIPQHKILAHDEALAELTRRYFASHGPATEEDFMWWSGLSRANVRSGLEMVKDGLAQAVVDDKTYWLAASTLLASSNSPAVHLLPNYDEYVVGYTDRSAIFDPSQVEKLDARRNPLFQHTLVIDGKIVGTWKRTIKKDGVFIEFNPFTPLTKAENQALAGAVHRYCEFLDRPIVNLDEISGDKA